MELLSVSLPKNHRIALAGDVHIGTIAMHRKGWNALLARVAKEKDLYLILMGDLVESIAVDDKRFSIEVHDGKLTPMAQTHAVIEDLKRIPKGKILGVLRGNHELKLLRYLDITREICREIGAPFGGFSCKLSVQDKSGQVRYKVFATHGRLTATSIADDPVRRTSNMRLAIKRRLQHLAGDAVVMATGHCHKLLTLRPERELYVVDDGYHLHARYTEPPQGEQDYIDPNLRWYCSTGSFLKSAVIGATTYSEAAMLAPVQLGYVELVAEDWTVRKLKEVHLGADDHHQEVPSE